MQRGDGEDSIRSHHPLRERPTAGPDIVHPKARAFRLAATFNLPIVAMPTETKQEDFVTAPLVVVTPEKIEKPFALDLKSVPLK